MLSQHKQLVELWFTGQVGIGPGIWLDFQFKPLTVFSISYGQALQSKSVLTVLFWFLQGLLYLAQRALAYGAHPAVEIPTWTDLMTQMSALSVKPVT